MRRWGIDLSYGVSLSSHFPEMVIQGLAFAIWRLGEGLNTVDNVTNQVSVSNDNGIPYGFYWAIHPWFDQGSQVHRFLDLASQYSPKCLWLDFELRGDEDKTQRAYLYEQAFEALNSQATLPIGNYSGFWFIDEHAPDMKSWIDKAPYWDAGYSYFGPNSWDQFQEQLSVIPMPIYEGYPVPRMWQFSGDMVTPMVPHQCDYNLIDDDALFAYLFQNGPDPKPYKKIQIDQPEDWEVAVEALTVRSGPGTGIAPAPFKEWLYKGNRRTITTKVGNWGNYAPSRWINLSAA